MSIQLGVGPHSASSLIRSDSSFQVNSIELSNITSTSTITGDRLNITNVNIQNDINISGNINANTTDLTVTNGSISLVNTSLTLDANSTFNINSDFDMNQLDVITELNTNDLNVTNNAVIHNNVTISGNLTVSGTNLFVGNNKVGINTLNPTETLEVNGNSKINNNLEVRGSMVIGGEDNFTNTNFEDFSKWGSGTDVDTQIYSKYDYVGINTQNPQYFLDVSGIINTKDRYFINGNTVLDSITLGSSIVNSNLTKLGILNDLTVTGETNLHNNLNISSNINITSDINLNGNLNNEGNINITGEINLDGNLKITNSFELDNLQLNITENTTLYNHSLKVQNLIQNTNKRLPPIRLSGNTQNINYFYGSGSYTLTTSSTNNSLFTYQLADQYTDTFFRSDTKYNSITGLYTGSENFNNLGVLGEWVKFELPDSYILNNMTIKVLNRFIFGKNPKEIHIYGSNDDNIWTQIQVFTNIFWETIDGIPLYTYNTFQINNVNSYKYYTFIVPRVGGKDNSFTYSDSDSFAIGELELYFQIDEFTNYNFYSKDEYIGIGTTNPNHTLDVKGDFNINGKFLIEDNEILSTSLISNLREYPPQTINLTSMRLNTNSETIESGNIKKNEVTYGDGEYEIYYSGFSPFFFPNIGSNVFNKVIDQNVYFRTIDSYDLNGTYQGNSSLNGINGEYIIIKLPQNILIKAFRIYSNLYDSEYFSPRNYTILGSLNKASWDILYQKQDEYFSPNGYSFIERSINTTSLYKYFAIVVSSVGNYDANYSGITTATTRSLKIQEFKLFGVEYNDFGVNYSTGIYIDGPLRVNGDFDVLGDIQLSNVLIEDLNVTRNISSNNLYINNLIGLGVTQNINGKLEISGDYGAVSLNNNSYTELTTTGARFGDLATNAYSIYANGKIAGSEFNAISDKRVKNILNDRDSNNDLDFINNVNIYDFEYIDKKTYGNKQKIGFMAQDLERLNNNLINYSTNFIPNVFNSFNIINKNKIILDKDYDIEINDILKIEINNGTMIQVNIIEKRENYIIIDKINKIKLTTKKVFIYGKKVEDFKTINFEQLIAINMNSIKNLYNDIKEIKENQKMILNHLNIKN